MKRLPVSLVGALSLGAALTLAAPAAAQAPKVVPSYTKDVAPIVFKNCVGCHRPGEIAPMSLLSYQETRPWAKAIRDKVINREMPPWHMDSANSMKFRNDRSLTQKEIDTVVAWVDGGAPKGNDADMPAVPQFSEGWRFATNPDYILEMPVAYEMPAEGEFDVQTFYVPTPWKEDVFAEKLEMRPSNKSVVHHATGSSVTVREGLKIVDGRPVGDNGRLLTQDEVRPAGTTIFDVPQLSKLLCYNPGRGYEQHEPGSAKRIKAGPNQYVTFGMHYQASGKPETDRSRLGIWFNSKPVQHEVYTLMVGNGMGGQRLVEGEALPEETTTVDGVTRTRQRIPNIPPYADNWKISGILPVPEPITLYSLLPHMHLRGKDVHYMVVYPDGREASILKVPKYSFEWQLVYDLEEPLKIPAGSKIVTVGHYDNSLKNKYNPGPDKEVFWSEQSWDEMYEPYIEFSIDSEDLSKQPAKTQQQQQQQQ